MHLKKLGRLLVLEILNRDNGENLTFDDVVFNEPIPLVVNEGIRNTRLLVERAVGSNYRNSKEIKYWRLDISKIITDPYRTLPGQGLTNTSQLVRLLNDFYDLALDQEDIIHEAIDTTTLPITYTLRTNSLSYAYIGSVELELSNDLVSLPLVIKQNILEDFITPIYETDLSGQVVGSESTGELPGLEGVYDTNFSVIQNGEMQLAAGIVIGSDVSVGPTVEGVNRTLIDLHLGETLNWNLVMMVSTLTQGRLHEEAKLTDFGAVNLNIKHVENGLQYTFYLNYVTTTGTYEWTSDKVIPPVSPVITYQDRHTTIHTYFELESILQSLFAPYVSSSDWATLGEFDFVLSCTPKNSVILQPMEFAFKVIAAS